MTGDDQLCILMEYCEHGDVDAYLRKLRQEGQTAPDERRSLEWLVQICLGLHALHTRRILHRDLKTSNIFLTGCRLPYFAIKLGDFGIARALSATTEFAMTRIGTPYYMSPEVFNNRPYSYKSDLWSVGCVFYELTNGRRAFEAQNINALAIKILNGSYTEPNTTCSAESRELIKALLNTRASRRPALKEVLTMETVQRR
eukprot:CAMPEP_0115170404 /NCGR_PEP_ID=MMETSP0270-20121206/1768_1 /TAXON_ID=71861 /ORGANISM="Scrippsiella trochoidea, Strain CCMP3099" /LENGTH=199 /DNA_ID=CAMNT_0002583135 /DNA_START=12 /DNA_END=607 /DNA_ORIENTATION=-